MASTSGSEQGSEEQWDDMAILRAFEEALMDQRSRSSAAVKPNTDRKHKRSNGKKVARGVIIEEKEEEEGDDGKEQHDEHGHPDAGVGMYGPPNAAGCRGYGAGSNPYSYLQQPQQQQPPSDVYQTAYAQAYAQLQAQFQAAHPAAPQPFGPGAQMPAFAAQPPYYPPPLPIPSMPTPFPGMPGVAAPFPGTAPSAGGLDDGLANVLMAWYQSGYYTGRFQAMQEMKMRGRR